MSLLERTADCALEPSTNSRISLDSPFAYITRQQSGKKSTVSFNSSLEVSKPQPCVDHSQATTREMRATGRQKTPITNMLPRKTISTRGKKKPLTDEYIKDSDEEKEDKVLEQAKPKSMCLIIRHTSDF